MKKIYRALFLLIFFTLAITTSCGPRVIRKKKRDKDISFARIMVKKEITVGLEDNFPPFAFRDEMTAQLKGFDIDLTRAICKKLEVRPKFKRINWAQKDFLLNSRSIDCIINAFSYSPSRDKTFTLSEPYIRTAGILTVMKDSSYFHIEDLLDKKIGVQAASSMIKTLRTAAKKHGGLANIQTFASADKALEALEKGEIDAVAHDVLVINDLAEHGGKPYRIIPQPLDADEYVIAFKKGDIIFKEKVESALLELAEDGTLEKISKKWFGSDIIVIGR